jgi:hypothetical protein
MMTRRPLFFAGAVYELVRFGFLFIFGIGILAPVYDQVNILTIMILSSPALLIAAGFVLLALFPDTYHQYRKLLALGKVLEMLPLMIAFLNSLGIISFADARRQFSNVGLLFGIMLLLDLLFFFFLVSYKRRQKKDTAAEEHNLPVMNEVEVKEK